MNSNGCKGIGMMKRSVSFGGMAAAWMMLIGALLAPPARAQEGNSHLGSVIQGTGTFTTSVSIQVPPYHGIEPKLTLGYSSTLQNGFVGVGWSLGGFSSVVRGGPHNSLPAYDGTDIFYLNGIELIACDPSPCATFGGTHRPKYENYHRIAYEPAGDRWVVTQKNGTRGIYERLVVYTDDSRTSTTYSWGIRKVIDVYGNAVTYNYTCPEAEAVSVPSTLRRLKTHTGCYVRTITYLNNGSEDAARITFYHEERDDPVVNAVGGKAGHKGAFVGTFYRLKSIDVQMNLSESGAADWRRIRAYYLTYDQSAETGQSVLTKIQQFGSDAVLDGAGDPDTRFEGDVTSGSALPPTEFGWQEPVNLIRTSQHIPGPPDPSRPLPDADPSAPQEEYSLTGDLNGDGRVDYLLHVPSNPMPTAPGTVKGTLMVRLSTGEGWGPLESWATLTRWIGGFGDARWLADIDGDGCDDFIYRERDTQNEATGDTIIFYALRSHADCKSFVAGGSGNGFAATSDASLAPIGVLANGPPEKSQPLGRQMEGLADFNGDGRADYFYEPPVSVPDPDIFNPNGNGKLYVLLARSDGFGFESPEQSASPWGVRLHPINFDNAKGIYRQWIADVNGDGMSDYLYQRFEKVYVYDNPLTPENEIGLPCPITGVSRCKDVSNKIYVMLSTGTGFSESTLWHTNERLLEDGVSSQQFADFNGDGKADYLYHGYNSGSRYNGQLYVALSDGSSFVQAQLWGRRSEPIAERESKYLLDFNADGLVDYLYLQTEVVFTGPQEATIDVHFRVMISGGSSFLDDKEWAFSTLPEFNVGLPVFEPSDVLHILRPVDVSGDGLPDLIYQVSSTHPAKPTPWHTFVFTTGGVEGPGITDRRLAVQTITNNRGLTTEIEYAFRYGKGFDYETTSGSNTFYRDFTKYFLPLGVVRRLTTSDAVTDNSMTTLYDYEGLVYSYSERSLLGFARADQTINDDGSYNPASGEFGNPQPYAESFFHVDETDPACVGQTLEAYVRGSDDRIYSAQKSAFWSRSTAPPYECVPEVQESYECERFASDPSDLGTCRLTKSVNDRAAVDAFGHPSLVYEYGEVCAEPRCDADDKTVSVRFEHHAEGNRFLVGFPIEEKVYEGIGLSGNLLQHTQMYYDQKPALGALGVLGELTQKRVWNDSPAPGEPEWLVTYNDYDEVGNLVFSQDPLGRRTWTIYDNIYRMFAVRTCNPRMSAENNILKHADCTPTVANTQREWDFLDGDTPFGVEISLTDWNGRRTESEYDVFGRLVRTRGPEKEPGTGELLVGADTIYQIDTVPNYTITCTYPSGTLSAAPCSEGNAQLESIAFVDGWGHAVQSKQKAEGNQTITSHVELDRMGRTVVSYNPFFESDSAFESYTPFVPGMVTATTSAYDEVGRLVRSDVPSENGGTSVYVTAYPAPDSAEPALRGSDAVGCTMARDARGNAVKSCKDGLGRTAAIEEDAGPGDTALTRYEYDTLGRLLHIRTDADTFSEVTVSATYDSLGRQLSMTDPNMGPILYEYDAAGNVTRKIESDGTTTRFEYDILDRLVRKCATQGVNADPVGLKKIAGEAPAPALSEYDRGGCATGEVEIASYEYDDAALPNSAGRLTAMNDLSGRTRYGYDERGRISLLTKDVDCDDPGSIYASCVRMSVVRTYDLAGRLTEIVFPDTETVRYEYQKRGLLSRVVSASSGHAYATGFQYNVAGEVTEVMNGNGVVSRRYYDPGTLRLNLIATDNYVQNHVPLTPDAIAANQGFSGGIADIGDDPDAPDDNWLTDAAPTRNLDAAPGALLDTRFYQGNLSDVSDDPDSPDGNWLIYSHPPFGQDPSAKFAFAPPPGEIPASGADLQRIRVLVRQRLQGPSGPATPQCSASLARQGVTLLQWPAQNVPPGESVLSFPWDAAVLGSAGDGIEVEIRCNVANPSGPDNGVTAEIGAVEWATTIYDAPELRVSFPAPPNDLYYGEGLQEFRVLLRPSNPSGVAPSARLELWEGGARLRAGPTVSVPAGGVVAAFDWDVYELSDPSGAEVELKVVSLPSGNTGADRSSVDVGAIEWVADRGSGVLQRLRYSYDPNGNVAAIEDLRAGAPDQSFEYDAMNRLAGAAEVGGYGYRGYRYDHLGNITKKCFDPACASFDEYGYESSRPHAVETLTRKAPGLPDDLTYGAAYDARGNMNLRTVVKVGPGGPTATDYRLQWGYDNRLHTVIEDPAGAADPLARYVYDGHGGRAVRYAQGAPTFYLGPWFELRLKDGKSVKRIPGTGALVSCSANRAQFLAAGTLTKFLRRYLQRSWQELTNPGLNFPAHQLAAARLYFALLVLLILIRLQAAQRLTRGLLQWIQKAKGASEAGRDLKAALLSKRAWKQFSPLEGPWTATRSFALFCAAAFVASSFSGCGENPYSSARDLVLGVSKANGSPPATAALSYVFADHLGGVNVVTNEIGAEAERKDYLPFGEKDESGIPPGSQPSDEDRGFAGTREEPGDLQGMGNRFYDPLIGRFTSADPVQVEAIEIQKMRLVELDHQNTAQAIGTELKQGVKSWQQRIFDPQDLNRFSYVHNNPINVIDVGGYSGRSVRAAFWRWWQKKQAGPLWKRILTFIYILYNAIGLLTAGLITGQPHLMFLGFNLAVNAWRGFSSGVSPVDMFKAAGLSIGMAVATTAAFQILRWAFTQIGNILGIGSADGATGGDITATSNVGADAAVAEQGAQASSTTTETTVRIYRFINGDNYTIGELSIDETTDVSGYTLEPEGPSSTVSGSNLRVPAGEYTLEPITRADGSQAYAVAGNHGRVGILIHVGNTRVDTTGCILPGTSYGVQGGAMGVWNSADMTNELFNHLDQYQIRRLIIVDNVVW